MSLTISSEEWSPQSRRWPLLYADRQVPVGSQRCSHTETIQTTKNRGGGGWGLPRQQVQAGKISIPHHAWGGYLLFSPLIRSALPTPPTSSPTPHLQSSAIVNKSMWEIDGAANGWKLSAEGLPNQQKQSGAAPSQRRAGRDWKGAARGVTSAVYSV